MWKCKSASFLINIFILCENEQCFAKSKTTIDVQLSKNAPLIAHTEGGCGFLAAWTKE